MPRRSTTRRRASGWSWRKIGDALGVAAHLDAPGPGLRDPSPPDADGSPEDGLLLTPRAKGAREEAGRPIRRGQKARPLEVLARLARREPPDPGAVLLDASAWTAPACAIDPSRPPPPGSAAGDPDGQ
ncbi:MAG: hypothetical protein ABSA31_00670 [Acidimicrobiales bacterium]